MTGEFDAHFGRLIADPAETFRRDNGGNYIIINVYNIDGKWLYSCEYSLAHGRYISYANRNSTRYPDKESALEAGRKELETQAAHAHASNRALKAFCLDEIYQLELFQ